MLQLFLHCSDDDDDVQVGEVKQDAKANTTDIKETTVSTNVASSGERSASSNSVSFSEDNNMDIGYDSNNNNSTVDDDDAAVVAEVPKTAKSCTNRKATPHVSRRKSLVSQY